VYVHQQGIPKQMDLKITIDGTLPGLAYRVIVQEYFRGGVRQQAETFLSHTDSRGQTLTLTLSRLDEAQTVFRIAIGVFDLWPGLSGDEAVVGKKDAEVSLAHNLDVSISFYVISLQGVPGAHANNAGRLDRFIRHFDDMCGQAIQFQVCPGVLDGRRGYGITRAFVRCLAQAQIDGSDLAFIFEDDARLFAEDGRSPRFCDGDFQRAFFTRKPLDALVVMLGGHKWKYSAEAKAGGAHSDFKHVLWGLGAYAFAVSRQDMPILRSGWAQDLAQQGFFSPDFQEPALSPDISWYDHASKHGKRVFAFDPILALHMEGWSNTWNQIVHSIDDQTHANTANDHLHGDNHPRVVVFMGEAPLVYCGPTRSRELSFQLRGEHSLITTQPLCFQYLIHPI